MRVQEKSLSFLCTVAVSFALCGCCSLSSTRSEPEPGLDAKFGHIRIESFSVSDARVPDVVKKLNEILKTKHGESILFVWEPAAPPETESIEVVDNVWEGDETEEERKESERIRKLGEKKEREYHSQLLTIKESNVSLPLLVKRIAVMADLQLSFQDGKIWLINKYLLLDSGVGPPNLWMGKILPRYAWVFEEPKKFFEMRGVFFGSDLDGTPEIVGFDKESSYLILSLYNGERRMEQILKLIGPFIDDSEYESSEQGNSGSPD